jgi:hypothetical protein
MNSILPSLQMHFVADYSSNALKNAAVRLHPLKSSPF